MARSAAWTRKEGQDPTGGLNARGRAAYKAATGGTLRPPVKSGDDPRRASFLARMGAVRGPMVRDGKPTRLALALRAWGASSKEDARKKARAISRRLREGNQMKKTRRNPASRGSKQTDYTYSTNDYRRKSIAELRYIIQDASDAARAMSGHNPKAETKYLEQLADAETELSRRTMKKTRRNPAKRKNTRFFQAKMRTEPLSDYELHLAKQLRTIDPAKLEKMVPAWARSEKIKQFRFVPGAAPVYPAYASGTTISPEKRVFPEYIEGESTDEYARRFYEANKLQFKANPRKRKAKTTPSQTTGRAPSARLMRRRKKTVAGPRGFFANPVHTFKVLTRSKPSAPFALVGSFRDKSRAMQYARAIHKASPTSLSVKVTT